MNKNYLPSKKFMSMILFVVVLVVLFFVVKGIASFFKNRKQGPNTPAKVMVVGDLIQKDSNNNGIPDWEEYLWGLNPKKSGPENKEFILAKKNALMQSGEMQIPDDSKTITDNELLSQEFFATIISLQQTGQLDDESMKSVSEAIGKNIESTPIPDIYTSSMLTIQSDSTMNNDAYSKALVSLVTKYQDSDIGNELTFIVQGLSNNDQSAFYAAQTVAIAYKSFGKDLMKLPVPKSISLIQLSAANNYEKVGQTINSLAQILTDPLIGMKAIVNYKNYSDALGGDLEKISEALQ